MARLLGTTVILILFIIGGIGTRASSAQSRRSRRSSYLKDFLAVRHEIFPLSSDLEREDLEKTVATPIPTTISTASSSSKIRTTISQEIIRPTRHSGASPRGARPSSSSIFSTPTQNAIQQSPPSQMYIAPTQNINLSSLPQSSSPPSGQSLQSRTNQSPSQFHSMPKHEGDIINPLTSSYVPSSGLTQESVLHQPLPFYFLSSHASPTTAGLIPVSPTNGLVQNTIGHSPSQSYHPANNVNRPTTTSKKNRPVARKIDDHRATAQLWRYTNSNAVTDFNDNRPTRESSSVDQEKQGSVQADPKPSTWSSLNESTIVIVTENNNVNSAPVAIIHDGKVVNPEHILEFLVESKIKEQKSEKELPLVLNKRVSQSSKQQPARASLPETVGFFQSFLSSLRRIPVIGNVLRATVDPIYHPLFNTLLPMAENRQSTDEFQEDVHCFDGLGCIYTTIDFYDPIIRPLNLPPDTREAINTHYTLYTRRQQAGVPLSPATVTTRITETSYNPDNPTKLIIHGFLDDQNSTWIKDMTRGLLHHGDYNVFAVDWSGGSRVIYHQAVTNIRVVALELAALINWLHAQLGQHPSTVHVLGHSLGAHCAGHVGERVPGMGRITGLDPAEPFFQYMPPTVRLDHTDAQFVDVIHTDTDSIMTLAWQLAGFGLEQPIGHIDFYPNGGRQQPGCSSLARIPLTALQEGAGLAEGLDAAEKEAVACNHIRANKLFTASLLGSCSFQAFPCESYKEFEKAKCFSCDGEQGCAPLGIHADTWQPHGMKHVKMYLSTSQGPDFCQYHYRLTLDLADEGNQGGSLRGRLTVTFITQEGELMEFDLTESTPLTFRRGSTRTFLLRHGEDLSSTKDALLRWQFEADVFNPLTFCVLFCTAELEVSTVTLTPLDTPLVTAVEMRRSGGPKEDLDIVMCHKQGNPIIKIKSEKTIKISAEAFCSSVKKKAKEKYLLSSDLSVPETNISDVHQVVTQGEDQSVKRG